MKRCSGSIYNVCWFLRRLFFWGVLVTCKWFPLFAFDKCQRGQLVSCAPSQVHYHLCILITSIIVLWSMLMNIQVWKSQILILLHPTIMFASSPVKIIAINHTRNIIMILVEMFLLKVMPSLRKSSDQLAVDSTDGKTETKVRIDLNSWSSHSKWNLQIGDVKFSFWWQNLWIGD